MLFDELMIILIFSVWLYVINKRKLENGENYLKSSERNKVMLFMVFCVYFNLRFSICLFFLK